MTVRGPADWEIEDARRSGRLCYDEHTGDVYIQQEDGSRSVVGYIPPTQQRTYKPDGQIRDR